MPQLVRKEAVAALAAIVVVCLISAVFDAPLQAPADPQGIVTGDVKAPWIFVGIQQLLRFLPPLLSGIIIPLGALVLLLLVPYLPSAGHLRRNSIRALFFGIIVISLAFTIWGYVS